MALTKALQPNIFSFPIRIYYEDTDAGGVVYHSNYLNFFERTRTEYLRELGFEQDDLIKTHDVVFVAHRVEINFIKPAKFNQKLICTAVVESISNVRIVFKQTLVDEQNTILSEALVTIASVNASSFKPMRIPSVIKEKLKEK